MKKSKLLITSGILIPLTIAPTLLTTSCSVYMDLFKEYKASYEPLAGQALTEAQANEKFFSFINDEKKLKDEMLSGMASFSNLKWEYDDLLVSLNCKCYFNQFLIHFDYCNIDSNKHIISYKFAGEANQVTEYYTNDEYIAHGTEHYSFNIEVKNMEYGLYWYNTSPGKEPKECWNCAPVKYWQYPEKWTTILTGDEEICFNNKYTLEVYNMSNKQIYSDQTTEGGLINKNNPLTVNLSWFVNSLVLNWPYYLKNCTESK